MTSRRRLVTAGVAMIATAASVASAGCRTPTQITVLVRTDVACDADAPETSITIGPVGEIDDPRRAPVTVVRTTTCRDHRIGALVVVPSGGKEDELAIRVVTGIGTTAQACVDGGYAGACIVSRRALHFVPHESLDLPIDMDVRCEGVPCDTTKTCVDGACVSDTISDPGACHDEGCAQGTLVSGSDAGVPDSSVDVGPDARPDVTPLDGADSGPSAQWAKALGDRKAVQGDFTIDLDGNVVVASSFRGTIDIDGSKTAPGGKHDGLLVKLSPDGTVQWARQLSGSGEDFAVTVATDGAGNIVLAGLTGADINLGAGVIASPGTSGMFLAKYDKTGKYLTAKRFPGGNEQNALGVSIDAAGNIFFAGNTGTDVDFGGGVMPVTNNDIFLARFGPDLTLIKSKVYGSSDDDFMRGFSGTKDGGVVLVGMTKGAIDFGDGAHTPGGGSDAYAVRIDSAFTATWSKTYGDTFSQAATAVAVDDLDRTLVGAFIDGSVNLGAGLTTGPELALVRLDKLGVNDLVATYPTSSYQNVIGAIDTDATEGIAFAGYFEDSQSFGGPTLTGGGVGLGDAFLVRIDATGGHISSTSFGDATALQAIGDLAFDRPRGATVVSGLFGGTLAFPFQTLVTTKTSEGFVARMIP